MPKQAILYLSHTFDKTLRRGYRRIQVECHGIADTYFVLNLNGPDLPHGAEQAFGITPAQREALGHPSREGKVGWWMDTAPSHTKIMQAGIDRAVLAFRELKPDYDYYWVVEYDVEFSGGWRDLFNAFSDNRSDLLCTNMHLHETNPNWGWWKSLVWPLDPEPELVRGFFPFARLSAKAADALILAGQKGVDGIYELVWPTVLNHEGLTIEDIGGNGPFVRPENVDRWYTSTLTDQELAPGSFVSRPIRARPGWKRNRLWHPIKRRFIRYVISRLASRLSRRREIKSRSLATSSSGKMQVLPSQAEEARTDSRLDEVNVGMVSIPLHQYRLTVSIDSDVPTDYRNVRNAVVQFGT